LTAQHRYDQRILLQQRGDQTVNCIQSCQIARENEEKEEGAEQAVIHHFQTSAVDKEQDRRNDDQTQLERDDSENDQDRRKEQNAVKNGLFDM